MNAILDTLKNVVSVIVEKTVLLGGITMGINGQEVTSGGYVIGAYPARAVVESVASVTGEKVLAFIEANLDLLETVTGACVGTWVDENRVCLDISIVESDYERAVQIAKEKGQLAIFNLNTFKTIELRG